MPRGSFQPLKNSVRFFGQLAVFTVECVYCGRLLLIGPGERDATAFDQTTSRVSCPADRRDHASQRGCGRQFLVGIVAWPLKTNVRGAAKPQRPPDQIPDPHQLAEIRAEARRGRGLSRPRLKNKSSAGDPVASPTRCD